MSSVAVVLRRVVVIVMLAALGGAAWAWWRDRTDGGTLDEPPSWPPLDPEPAEPSSTPASSSDQESPMPAPVDAAWVGPEADGSCPLTHPVKAKESSGIYHVSGGRMYERTKADRCYTTADAAERDGYRRSKT